MSRSTRIFFEYNSRFAEENREKKGELKKRAMRVLAAQIQDEAFSSFHEVRDPAQADAVFRMIQQEGSKGWKLHRVKGIS